MKPEGFFFSLYMIQGAVHGTEGNTKKMETYACV